MPNWVYNTVTITGDAKSIKEFKEKAARTTIETDREGKNYEARSVFSFWNFVTPPSEAIDSGEYHGTHGWKDGEPVGHTPNNWYEFNVREWGTKWDACEDEVLTEEATEIAYSFATAWSPPEPIFHAMVQQHPKLQFNIHWQEEGGFGAEYEGGEGSLVLVDEWDIPSTHEEMLRRQNYCQCEHLDPTDPVDREQYFDDCPDKNLGTHDAVKMLEEIESKMPV